MNQPPLNPDALEAAEDELWAKHIDHEGLSIGYYEASELVVSTYLAAALPEVTGVDPRELNRRGWTCGCEPGNYDTCDECQSACNELAGFLSRPEVKP